VDIKRIRDYKIALKDFLTAIEMTKFYIEPLLSKWLKILNSQVKNKNIIDAIKHAISSPSWRERATIFIV